MTRRVNQKNIQYISEKLRDVDWHDLSLIGTELGEIETIRNQPFQFNDFLDALDDGFLSKLDHPVYVFLLTEPVYFPEGIILTVPVLVAYSSAVPPPNLVARDSVQSEDANARALNPFGGRPEPMEPLKMSWKPYIPARIEADALPYILSGALAAPVVSLEWEVRQQKVSHFKELEANAIKFINPYVILPKVFRALEKPEVTSVSFEYKFGDKTCDITYDKEVDGPLAEFIPACLSDNELPETPCAEEIKSKIKELFQAQTKIRDEQWDETQALLGQYTPEQLKLLEEAKVYKFYPRHPKYDLTAFVNKRVNRYFKDADEVFGGKKIEKEEMSESDVEEFERFEKSEEKRLKDLEIAQNKERRRLERLKMTKEELLAEKKAKREAERKRLKELRAKKAEKAKAKAKEEEEKKKKKAKKATTASKKTTKAVAPKKTTKTAAAAAAASGKKTATKKSAEKKTTTKKSAEKKTTTKKERAVATKKIAVEKKTATKKMAAVEAKKRKHTTSGKKSGEPSAKKSKK